MRRKFLFVVPAVLCVLAAFPDGTGAATVDLGLKGGLNMAGLSGDYFKESGGKTGFIGGASLGIGLSDRFGARVEALYATQGGTHQDETFNFDYIQVPLLAVVNIRPSGNLTLFPFVGPAFAFKVRSWYSDSYGSADVLGMKGFDMGLVFGVGGAMRMRSYSLLADLRFDPGVMKDNVDSYTYTGSDDEAAINVSDKSSSLTNTGFGLMLGVSIPLGD